MVEKESKLSKINAYSTAIIALATVINLVVAVFMWIVTRQSLEITRQSFLSTNRPYLGSTELSTQEDTIHKTFSFALKFTNRGPVPAKNVAADWRYIIDGISHAGDKIPVSPGVVFPQQEFQFKGVIGRKYYDGINNGTHILRIVFEAHYYGVTDNTYYDYEEFQYEPKLKMFLVVSGDWR